MPLLWGVFILAGSVPPALGADSNDKQDAKPAQVTLNFEDADIRKVAHAIGDIAGKDFILDPQVQGRVTVISSKPIPADAVYDAFLSVLEVHGFAAVPAGPVTKIIPALKARQVPGVGSSKFNSAAGDAMITRVIAVENVPAAQLVPVLRPLMSTQSNLASYQPANILVISDRVSNVKRIDRLIHKIDQSGTNDVEVVKLEYASAADIVRVLGGLMQDANRGASSPIRLAADSRTNSILIAGPDNRRLRVKALIAQLDQPREKGGNTQVIYLHYAKAEDISKVLKGFVDASAKIKKSGKGTAASTGGKKTAIIADEGTNSVVVTAPPKMMRSIKGVINKLDIRRAEVFVQAVIAELSSNHSAELGITWAADAIQNHGTAGLTNYSGTGTGVAQIAGAIAAGQSGGVNGTNFGGAGGTSQIVNAVPDGLTLGIGRIVSGGFSFAALLRALAGDSQTNILSAPSLVTLDNQEAKITVGQQVPFVTGSYSNGGVGGGRGTGGNGGNGGIGGGGFVNPFNTVNRKQVGITLKITPQINKGKSVRLKIHQTVSNIAASSQGAVDLITNNREIKTTVIAKSGQIIVLGGLIQNNQRQSVQKVPLLGDIPLLGNLFRYRSNNDSKQNLMVFIRPSIIRKPQAMTYYTNAKYDYMRNLQQSNNGESLLSGNKRPLLPPFNAIKPAPGSTSSDRNDTGNHPPSEE